MTNLPDTNEWVPVPQIEEDTVWKGGPNGDANNQGKALAKRTAWLKQQVAATQGGLEEHEAAVDPHQQYLTSAEGDAKVAAHAAAADPHPIYLTAAEGDAKVAAAVSALVGSSQLTLDTIQELGAALGNDANFSTTVLAALAAKITQEQGDARYFRRLSSGAALPTTNIGPIWHDDYNSLMTWQAFTANSANYTGYASVLVGNLLIDTQPTPRAGYVRSGVTSLNRVAYAALRGWAMHNGIMVAAGVWAAGTVAVKDNADGTTFTAFDVRGQFPRFWDDGLGNDAARIFGSSQSDDFKSHSHSLSYGSAGSSIAGFGLYNSVIGSAGTTNTGGTETRPRNTAFLAAIKF